MAEQNVAEDQSRRQQTFSDSAGERIFPSFRRDLTQRHSGDCHAEGHADDAGEHKVKQRLQEQLP